MHGSLLLDAMIAKWEEVGGVINTGLVRSSPEVVHTNWLEYIGPHDYPRLGKSLWQQRDFLETERRNLTFSMPETLDPAEWRQKSVIRLFFPAEIGFWSPFSSIFVSVGRPVSCALQGMFLDVNGPAICLQAFYSSNSYIYIIKRRLISNWFLLSHESIIVYRKSLDFITATRRIEAFKERQLITSYFSSQRWGILSRVE